MKAALGRSSCRSGTDLSFDISLTEDSFSKSATRISALEAQIQHLEAAAAAAEPIAEEAKKGPGF